MRHHTQKVTGVKQQLMKEHFVMVVNNFQINIKEFHNFMKYHMTLPRPTSTSRTRSRRTLASTTTTRTE